MAYALNALVFYCLIQLEDWRSGVSPSKQKPQLSATDSEGISGQIVHESETQRQYIRLKMPAQVEIDGVRYTAKDLSSGGMAVHGFEKMPRKGSRHDVKLLLPFFDFSLDINLVAEVVHTDKKMKGAGLRFVDMTASQMSILNHVLSAFISGDIIDGSGILNIVARDNFVKVRQHSNHNENSTAQNIKKYVLYGLFTILTFALSFFIINNILDRLTVIRSAQAFVSAPVIDIKAPSSGQFSNVITDGIGTVKEGQVIANIAIKTPSETGIVTTNSLPIISPCDCYIAAQNVQNNTYVSEGQKLFAFINHQSDITISALIPMEEATRLKTGTRAKMRLAPSGKNIRGKVFDIQVIESNDAVEAVGAPLQSRVIIKPDVSLSQDEVNNPAFVEFYL